MQSKFVIRCIILLFIIFAGYSNLFASKRSSIQELKTKRFENSIFYLKYIVRIADEECFEDAENISLSIPTQLLENKNKHFSKPYLHNYYNSFCELNNIFLLFQYIDMPPPLLYS